MSNRIIEIQLKKIILNYRGQHTRTEDVNVFGFTLHYPHAGKKTTDHIKTIPIKRRQKKSISLDFTKKNYQDQVVFKESIQGDTSLTIEVGNVNEVSEFAKFITGIFKDVLKARVGAINLSSTSKTSAAKSFGGSLLKTIFTKQLDQLSTLNIDLSQGELETLFGTEKTYTLEALNTIKSSEVDDEGGGHGQEDPEIIIKKDDKIGEITLAFKQI